MSMENWQNSVIRDRADDYFYRLCLAGVNGMAEINKALRKAGFAAPTGGHAFWGCWERLRKAGRVVRLMRGQYFATCPHCGKPIIDVMGAEH